jgi:hypothetical protein
MLSKIVKHKRLIIITVTLVSLTAYMVPLESLFVDDASAQSNQRPSDTRYRGPPSDTRGEGPPSDTPGRGPPEDRGPPAPRGR